jgi:MFS family permease
MAGGAFSSQFQPLLSDLGVPGPTAALLGAWYAASVILGRLGAGFFLDRLWPPAVGAVALSGPIVGMLLFLGAEPSLVVLAVGATLVGLSTGAEADMLAFFAARYFGLKRFGAIFGVLGLFFGLSVAAGGIAAGFIFDQVGDYNLMLKLGSVLAAASALCLLASGLAKGRPARTAPNLALEPAAAP